MRTASAFEGNVAAPIVRLLDSPGLARPGDEVGHARAFAEPLITGRELPTGEGALAHGDGVATILAELVPARRCAPRRIWSTPPISSATPTRC